MLHIRWENGILHGMTTPDHTPKGRGFDSSLNYFHHANGYFNEMERMCNETKIVDLWDMDKLASALMVYRS